jgi:hypothetical protein
MWSKVASYYQNNIVTPHELFHQKNPSWAQKINKIPIE